MAEGDHRSTNVVAAETASLEEQLQGWGEAMLMADKVLRWERAWFPPAITGVVSLVFLSIYYLDPTVLSGVSCFVMFLGLADYLVPILAPRIFGSNKWTTEQQQRFHEICSNLVKTRRRTVGWWKRLFTPKEEKPKMYFMTMIISLAAVAWVGQQVHNLLLTYLMVTFLLLLPGLNQHGIISKYIGMAKREMNKLLKQKEKKNGLCRKPGIDDSRSTSRNEDLKVEEEEKKQTSSKRKVTGNKYNAAADDSDARSQQSKGEQTEKQQLPIMENEDSDRFILRKEKEKRRKGDLICEKYRVQLRKKEEHCIKEVEINPPLETTIRAKDITLANIRDNEVSGSSEKEKCRSDEKRMLWDEIAKLRLKMDSVKNQTLEMGKGYFEDIAIGKEKKDHPQKTITETESQHNAQLEVLRAEVRMLNHKLEMEQQNRGRLEAQVESYRSRLATVVQDHEHCQASNRELQLASQRARDAYFCLWDKMNSDMSNLKHNNEIRSQRLSEVESKNSSLEIELHHIRDALKKRTLVSEGVERDLSQKQCQKEETEHVYQKEPGGVDKDIGQQESFMERLSQLQSEMMLLQQQLDQDHNQADREEKTATVRQLQQELADTKRKLSTTETFLEIESRHHMHLEDKKPDFKNNLDQSRSQNDDLIGKLQPSSSNCIRLDEEKTAQEELSREALLKECKELEAETEQWKQMVKMLRRYQDKHMAEDFEVEKHTPKLDELVKDITDNMTQLDLFLQTQRASQEISEPLTCTHNASNRSHLELRTPLLQTSQDDSRKRIRKTHVTLPISIGTQQMIGKETNFGSEAASRGQHRSAPSGRNSRADD